ncbi:MAG: ClpXP protease specificity-enhancing factor [Burkholderiales bacterium]|nr:ClpXP protease specificity-enhancing factor [Burkholderiales bacterium]
MSTPDNQGTPTRPYLLRALHDWCTDNGFTPYIAVHVDASVQVPGEYVKNNEIVLNVGFEATSGLKLGNEFIEFKARFGGVPREIVVPVDHVVAIYARENGQGMAFPMPAAAGPEGAPTALGSTPGSVPTAPVTTARPRAAAPARGLRLARQGAEGIETVPGPKPPGRQAPAAPEPPSEPPTPPEPGAPRPSLKRIK